MSKAKFKEPVLVKITEAAKILGVHKDTLRRWEKAGKIKVLRHPDGSRLYDISYLAQFDRPTQTLTTTQLLSKSSDIPHPHFSSFLKKEDKQSSIPVISNKLRDSSSIRKSFRLSPPQNDKGSTTSKHHIDIRRNLKLFGGFLVFLAILTTTLLAIRYFPANQTSKVFKETSEVNSNVLAATTLNPIIKMNADLKVNKSLEVVDTINGLLFSATESGILITDPKLGKTLTITGDNIVLDQSFAAGNTPTIEGLNLTADKNQLVLGPSGGVTGTLTWTPTNSNKTITLPNVTDTLVSKTTTDTLSNKTIKSGDSNTISGSFPDITGITSLGTVSTGTWNGTKIGTGYGGTGLTAYTKGDILYSSASDTLSKLTIGSSGQILTVSSGIPSWTTSISGSGITADSLDFTELSDSMTLDANLSISPSASNYSVNIDSGTLFVDTANNRIGINDTTPSYSLDITGTLNITGATTLGSTLGITGATTLSANNAALTLSGTTPSITSGSSVLGIFAGGNVGIGTTATLGSSFVVNGNTNIGSGYLTSAGPSNGLSVQGNVGIGTTSPTSPLHVIGNANVTGTLTVSGNIVGSGSGGVGGWSRDSSNGYLYASTLTDKIGIGSSAPASQLEIKASSNPALTLYAGSGTNNIFEVLNNSGTTTYFAINSSGQLNANAFQLTDAAKAIVGTAVPGAWANIASVATNDFTYRRAVSVTATGNLAANYEVTLDITTAATANQIYSNTYGQSSPYKDFRLFYTTDSGSTYTEVARNVTNFSSTRVTLTFQLSAAITSGNTSSTNYYLFYSNSSYSSMTTPSTYTGDVQLDSMDSIGSNWPSSDDGFVVSQETTTKQEGTGSLKAAADSANVGTLSTSSQGQLAEALSKPATILTSISDTNYLYILGGRNGAGTDSTNVYKATLTGANVGVGSTASQGQLPQGLSGHAAVSVVPTIDGGTGADGTLDLSLGSGAGGCNGTGLSWNAGTSTCTIATATKSTFNFTTINVSSGTTLTTDGPYGSAPVSIPTLKATGNVTIGGTVNLTGKGYNGGVFRSVGIGPGGGGAGRCCAAGAGGGGGNGGSGGNGAPGGGTGGAGGNTYTTLEPGSGGGGAYEEYFSTAGGSGGGAIAIQSAGTITVSGTINADGNAAADVTGNKGNGGGGGSGGLVVLKGSIVTVSSSISANGGKGGNGLYVGGFGAGGGGGGGGRIQLTYVSSISTTGLTVNGGNGGLDGLGGATYCSNFVGCNGSAGASTQASIAPSAYTLGGLNGSTAQLTVYKSSISGSDLGTFATTSQSQLPVALKNLTANVVTISSTNYLYALGGNTGSADVSTVYKSTIDSSGNVGAFSTTSQDQLPQVLSSHSSVIVSDGGTNYIYVIGGINGSTRQSTVYRATIDSSGNIGTFATTGQTQLPVALSDSAVTSVATGSTNYIYLFGGLNSSGVPINTVYKGTLDGSGNISSWTSTGQAAIPTALSSSSAVSATISSVPYAYLIGGLNSSSSPVLTVYKSQINDMSNYIATRTISSTSLTNKNDITFYAYSATTGTYLTFEINNGSGWQACNFSGSANFTISSASTWEQKNCDITGISSRSAVTGLRFRVASNQTADVTVYFDDIQAQTEATGSEAASAGTSVLGSANLSLNAQGTGIVRINYSDPSDTTNFPNAAGSGGMVVYGGTDNALATVNSSGNLGIGTTGPGSKLIVIGNVGIGTSAAGVALQVNGGGLFGWGTASTSLSSGAILGINGNVGIGTTTANYNLSVVGTGNFTGNVGIGATTSSNKLDVWGNERVAGTLTIDSTSSFGGNLTLSSGQFLAPNGTFSLPGYSFTNSTSTGLYSPSTNALALNTNGASTPPFTITAGGNIGVGLTNPGSKFTVIGNVGIGTSATGSSLAVNGNGVIGWGTTSVAGPSNGLAVSGNVGIGTTSPVAPLQVWGNGTDSGLFLNGNVGIGFTSPTSLFQINSGATAFTVSSTGNVGIGASLTNTGLIVANGGLNVTGLSNLTGNVGIGSSLTVNSGVNFLSSLSVTGNTQLSTLTTSGNVGMGASASISSYLSVGSLYSAGPVCLGTDCRISWPSYTSESTTASNGLTLSGVDVRLGGFLTQATGIDIAGQNFGFLGNVGIGTSVNSGGRLSVLGGNVGIGTTTANSLLSVAGGAHIGSVRQGIAAPTDGLFVDGNVGIGATTSNNKLDVWGSARITAGLTLDGLSSSAATALCINSSNQVVQCSGSSALTGTGVSGGVTYWNGTSSLSNSVANFYWDSSNNRLGIGTSAPSQIFQVNPNSSNPFVVTSGGNVGIGTTIPSYQLQTTGNVGVGGSLTVTSAGIFGSLDTSSLSVSGNSTLSTLTTSGNVGMGASASISSYLSVGSLYSAGPVCLGTDCRISWPSYTSESTTASNGLTLSGVDARLGGFLTQNTAIDINGKNFGLLGNIGIGLSNPGTTLTVAGNVNIGYTGAVSDTLGLSVRGNIGIGTTSPSYPLHVIGNVGIGGALTLTGNNAALALSGTTPSITSGGNVLGIFAGGNVGIGTTATLGTSFVVNGNVNIGSGYISSAGPANGLAVQGNLGIGTTSPIDLFQVQGPGSMPSLLVTSLGNVGIGTSVTSNPLTVGINGSTGNGAYLSAGGVWTNGSSREFKENFTLLDDADILSKINQLPILEWNYKLEDPSIKHIGPIAEDFYALFGVGNDNKHISTIDPAGIALAGIKAQQKQVSDLMSKQASISAILNNLSIDSEGVLIVPKLQTGSIILDSSIEVSNALNSFNTPGSVYYDLSGKIASLEERIAVLEAKQYSSTPSASTADEATPSSVIASDSEAISSINEIASSSSTPRNDDITLNLTPPEILLATGSATLANITVTSEATVSGLLTSYDLNIQNSLKSFGKTTLSDTTIAGSLSVDGTMTISGNSLSTLGNLYIQNSSLAGNIDIFGGKVIIDSSGLIKTASLQTDRLILGAEVLGESIIIAGSEEIIIETKAVTEKSKIFITSQSDIDIPLFVTDKIIGQSFKVKTKNPSLQNIIFDWVILESP